MRWLLGLAAIFVVLAIAAALAPASLLADRVAQASRGELRLVDAQGTVWDGRARLVDAAGRWSLPLAWQLAAVPLVRGEAHFDVRAADAGPGARASIVARDGTVQARDVDVTFPAGALRLPAGVVAAGDVRLTSEAAVVGAGRNEGTLRIEWTRARLAVPGVPPLDLGTAQATLAADGERWRGPVQARGGAAVIDGDVSVDAAGADVTLAIVPQPAAPEAVRQWLGPADAQGVVRLRASPRFR